MVLINDFLKALEQMFSGRFIWVLLKSLLLTVVLLVGVSVGFGFLLQLILPDSWTLPFIGEIGVLDELLSLAAVPVLLILSSFLMFPVAALFYRPLP